ncbi:MAG: hypothetical protein DRJ10_02410 [Bacteroidetes bacterium]|nr:MAG: hypothetical protein DRJ07_16260 [Bacteroidota bacterium]RLD83966.1 MAG: hypothetical protein DRJ10_02410 [Bacteroidota bacterium]
MRKSVQHLILIGLFLVVLSNLFIQCSQNEKSKITDTEWASLPSNGPYLSEYERIICSSEATKSAFLLRVRNGYRLIKAG